MQLYFLPRDQRRLGEVQELIALTAAEYPGSDLAVRARAAGC